MTITLTPEQEELVNQAIAEGRFETPEAVIANSLMYLRYGPDDLDDNLVAELEAGIADAEAGNVVSGDEVRAHFQKIFEEARQRA